MSTKLNPADHHLTRGIKLAELARIESWWNGLLDDQTSWPKVVIEQKFTEEVKRNTLDHREVRKHDNCVTMTFLLRLKVRLDDYPRKGTRIG